MRPVVELFARQDGLATVRQLRDLGVTEGRLRQRLATGEWERISQTVIGVASTPVTWRRQVRAAWLDAGHDTAISHSTAGKMHGFDGFDRISDIHVTVCGSRHRTTLPGIVLHRSQLLDEQKGCVWIDGMRVVIKPIALLQIAGSMGEDPAAKALDGVLRDGTSAVWIERVVSGWRRPRVAGPAIVLKLLRQRVDHKLPRSWFQRLASRVLATREIRMVDEFTVNDPKTGKRLADLDLAIPELQIGVECQSLKWHGSPGARARDRARKRRLRLLGWELVELWWTDLRNADEVVAEVEYLIDQRRPARLLS